MSRLNCKLPVGKLMVTKPYLNSVSTSMLVHLLKQFGRKAVQQMDRLLSVLPSAKELSSVAKAGAPKQGWYRASTQAIIDVFGVQDAPRFSSLLAAMSPQTSVEMNLLNTLNTWKKVVPQKKPTRRAGLLIQAVPSQCRKATKSQAHL